MKKVLLTGFAAIALGLTGSVAQDGAIALFDKVKILHGGAALEGLTTYRDNGTLSLFDEKGQVVAIVGYKQLLDFSNQRIRIEILQDKNLLQVQQATPTEAWSWSQQSGVVRLPPAQSKVLRDSLFQELYGFRAKAADIKDLKVVKTVKIGTVEGTQLGFSLNGAINNPVVAADGTLLASISGSGDAETTNVYADFRDVKGVRFPWKMALQVAGKAAAESKAEVVEPNVVFSETDFARPK